LRGSRCPPISAPRHVPHRHGVDAAGHCGDLDQGVYWQLLQALPVPGPLAGRVGAQPGVIPQLADLGGRHEAGPQHPPAGQLGQPHRVQLAGHGTPRRVLHIPRVHQLNVQASRLHEVEERPPPGAGRLQHHLLDLLAGQVPCQLDDLPRGRPDRPHPGDEPARRALARHPRAHHGRRLGHVDRRDPGHRLLVLAILDLLRPVAVLESDGVGRDRQVSPPGEFGCIRLVRIAAQSDDFALAKVELASVLVVAEDDGHALRRSIGDAHEGRSPAAWHVVGDGPALVSVALHLGQDTDVTKNRRLGRPKNFAQ